jgi:hypothetical protein
MVEQTAQERVAELPEAAGALHIYSPSQIEKA